MDSLPRTTLADDTAGAPPADPVAQRRMEDFLSSVAEAGGGALFLDFDGTLAPFHADRMQAKPWPGVAALIEQIQQQGRTRLAIVTGRPAREAAERLGLAQQPEIWGLHGVERLTPDGRVETQVIAPAQQSALAAARSAINDAQLGFLIEDKANAIVVHWRGRDMHDTAGRRVQAGEILEHYAAGEGVELLHFDGGIEFRVGRNKGDAVRLLLAATNGSTPAAYLGDDTTDEQAFRAISGRGLGILVRPAWRPTAAEHWLQPPAQLRGFLKGWLDAAGNKQAGN